MFPYMINTTKITKITINISPFSNLAPVVFLIINIIIFCIFKFIDLNYHIINKS